MHTVFPYHERGSARRGLSAALLLFALVALSHAVLAAEPAPDPASPRSQLSIGYTLLYQEADGIPKLNWILMFKDKSAEMARLTHDLVSYYQQLADTMSKLSKRFPAMRIDVTAMSKIEADGRKAIGEDMAKDFAPLAGKHGKDFEREALLMFYNSLNEQRHLVGVMLKLETNLELSKFLTATKAQLEERYSKVGTLLNRSYFTH